MPRTWPLPLPQGAPSQRGCITRFRRLRVGPLGALRNEARQSFGHRGDTVPIDMRRYPEAYSRFLELQGHETTLPQFGNVGMKDAMNAIVSGTSPLSVVYNMKADGPNAGIGSKEDMLKHIMQQYQEAAKAKLLDEYPALNQEVEQKVAAKHALRNGGATQ